jgi:hypothetical protein
MTLRIGGVVTFTDTRGRDVPALVTAIHGPVNTNPSINVVHVSLDEFQTDSYGIKTVRASSVVHVDNQSAHGNYYTLV